MGRKVLDTCLIIFGIILIIATFIVFFSSNILPDGLSLRYGIDNTLTFLVLLFWIIAELAIVAFVFFKISKKYYDRRVIRILVKFLLLVLFLFVMLVELWLFLLHAFCLASEQEVVEDKYLYILSNDFLDPYHYYNLKVNTFLQKEIPAEEQIEIAKRYPDLAFDEEHQIDSSWWDEKKVSYNYSSIDVDESSSDEYIISEEEYNTFKAFEVEGEPEIFNTVEDSQTILDLDYTGTWYDPVLDVGFRLMDNGYAYYYCPRLDYYGDVVYKWELIDRSDRGLCPALIIDTYGYEGAGATYYIAGYKDNCIWCKDQASVLYKQK